jgi:hypothetical protein
MKRYHVEIRVSDLDVCESHSETMEVPDVMMDHIDWDQFVQQILHYLQTEIYLKQWEEKRKAAGAE